MPERRAQNRLKYLLYGQGPMILLTRFENAFADLKASLALEI